jgi:hypothetical protein
MGDAQYAGLNYGMQPTSDSIISPPAPSAEPQAEITFKCSAKAATLAKLLPLICELLQKANVSAVSISGYANADDGASEAGGG